MVPSLKQVLSKHSYYYSFLYLQGLAQTRYLVAERGPGILWVSLSFLEGDLARR